MLSRQREKIVLLLGLVAVNGLLGWQLHRQWQRYRERTRWIYAGRAAAPVPALAPSASASLAVQSFAEIVERNAFDPERRSGPAGGGQPELPILYGVMSLGSTPFALMAPAEDAASGRFKKVLPGEEISGYQLLSIAGTGVVLGWGDKQVPLEVAESAQRVPRRTEKTTVAPAAAPPAETRVSPVTTAAPAASSPGTSADERRKFTPAGYNAPPGAPVDAPAGTVFGGKRKVVRKTPFGDQVWWEDLPAPSPKGEEKKEKD